MPETSSLVEAMTVLQMIERLLLDFREELSQTKQHVAAQADPVASVERLTPYLVTAVHQLAVFRLLLKQQD
jgi:hypothetical protein